MTAPTADTDLTSLKARALKAYATKDYPLSADLYAQACEVQSNAQGDDNPKNAHLLYLYGRSLYKVAQAKSDVLGGGAANEKEAAPAKPQKGLEDIAEEEAVSEQALKKDDAKAKGLFQFQGDENWDDVDDEDDAAEEGAEGGEEEEDDMTQAWEILDLARVQFEKQLAAAAAEKPAESSAEDSTAETLADAPVDTPADTTDSPAALSSDETRNIKTMLADVYDLLGEVSLESESFPQASKDLASSLTLKLELYEPHTTYIPEAHFKLALALEFSAAGEDVEEAEATRLREEAAGHLEKAIDSCRARIAREEAKLAASDSDSKGKGVAKSNAQIEDVQDMIKDLEQKVGAPGPYLATLSNHGIALRLEKPGSRTTGRYGATQRPAWTTAWRRPQRCQKADRGRNERRSGCQWTRPQETSEAGRTVEFRAGSKWQQEEARR